MANLLKGIDVVNQMKDTMLLDVSSLKEKNILPCLAILRVGEKSEDLSYERSAIKRCDSVGIKCVVFNFPEDISHQDLENQFININTDPSIHGILIFRPLPKQIDPNRLKHLLDPKKDIDCFTSQNIAKIFEGDPNAIPPCTPQAVIEILEHNNIQLEGKNVVIVGRSMVVGKPLSMMLLSKNATVTICHTKTANLKDVCKKADILIAAVGKAKIINNDYVSCDTIVIDVGINIDESGNLCGDVDFENVKDIASLITPVPGGIGTVTTSVLANHVIKAAKNI